MMTATCDLVDGFGRRHENLRVSVTDRCNIRCTYCMPEVVTFLNRADILRFEEIERLVRLVVGMGIRKVRLTGGEPLVRRDLPELVARLARVDGLEDLSLTTNGLLLAGLAGRLREAGLGRLNISLDTLDPGEFERITRRTGLEEVLAGIDAAIAAGFERIKLNAVILRGVNEGAVLSLAKLARAKGLELRFIESMPLDGDRSWDRGQVLSGSEILARLVEGLGPLRPAPDRDGSSPSVDFVDGDGRGRFGVIASVTQPFCASCNRLRLTAEGKLRNCLFAHEETDLRGLLRNGATDETIAGAVRRCVAAKWAGHGIGLADFVPPDRAMYAIGG